MYCQPEDVRLIMDDEEPSDDILMEIIPAVCEGIDGWCHRSFSPQTKTRLYDYKDAREVKLREGLVSITSVTTNAGQTFGAADFILLPNDDPPYYWIRLKSGKTFTYTGTPEQAISINGSWGYKADVPADIALGAKMWTGIVYNNLAQLGFESVKTGTLSAALKKLTAEPPDEIKALINRHLHVRIGSF